MVSYVSLKCIFFFFFGITNDLRFIEALRLDEL